MTCTECGAPVDAAPTCRYCGAPRVEARGHDWRDTDETIDVSELCEWILGKLEQRGLRPNDAEQLRILRGAVVAAIRRDDPEVRVRVSLESPNGPIEISELLTRTAARTLFANVSGASAHERAEARAQARAARRHDEPVIAKPKNEEPERPKTFWDKPSMPYVVTAALMILVFALGVIFAVTTDHDHTGHSSKKKSEGHH